MPFTAVAFGRKLASLRSDFGQDLGSLATASGISADRLEMFERGDQEPTGDEVLILADYFHKDFRFFLSDEALDSEEGVELLFREHGSALSARDRIAISEFAYLCRCQAALELDLGRKPSAGGFNFQPQGTYYIRQGRECAAALRRHLGLSEKQVLRDIFDVMRQLGIKVFRRRLENSEISGLFMNHPVAGRCILVNRTEGMARQRFSAAHELGHGLLDSKSMTFSMVGEWASDDLVEVRANAFASEFLMPAAFLSSLDRARWSEPGEVLAWAERLRVSVPALLSALSAAKLIDAPLRTSHRAQVRSPPEPPDPELEGSLTATQTSRKLALIERGLSKSYVDLCFDAHQQGAISRGLLSEMLLTTPAETNAIAALFGRSVAHE